MRYYVALCCTIIYWHFHITIKRMVKTKFHWFVNKNICATNVFLCYQSTYPFKYVSSLLSLSHCRIVAAVIVVLSFSSHCRGVIVFVLHCCSVISIIASLHCLCCLCCLHCHHVVGVFIIMLLLLLLLLSCHVVAVVIMVSLLQSSSLHHCGRHHCVVVIVALSLCCCRCIAVVLLLSLSHHGVVVLLRCRHVCVWP